MPLGTNLGDDASDPRIIAGQQLLEAVEFAMNILNGRLIPLREAVFALRAEIIANEGGYFILPDDLNYVNGLILAYRNLLQNYVNTLV